MSQKVLDEVIRIGVHQGVKVYEFDDYVAERIPAHLMQEKPDRDFFVAKDEPSENAMYPLDDRQVRRIRTYFASLPRQEQ